MDKKVYIIHGSGIVQHGLSLLLRKNFRCSVRCHSGLSGLLAEEGGFTADGICFMEEGLATGDEYRKLAGLVSRMDSIILIQGEARDQKDWSGISISLNHSAEEIYERIKPLFSDRETADEEPENLSNREIEVLKLVALGFANKEIADKLFISTHTVISHRKNITEKLGIKSISGLTVYAIINNHIDATNLEVKDLL